MKKNVILADCVAEEIETFKDACNDSTGMGFVTLSSISNKGRTNALYNLVRYFKYFSYPFEIFLNREKYDFIMGWQQFYAINFALYCRLFGVKKTHKVAAVNFTYKRKGGVIGKIYHAYMKYALDNDYIDYFHVPSNGYVDVCCKDLGLPKEKFLVANFGIPDTSNEFKKEPCSMENFSLSIGRSNRDFDFLVNVWSHEKMKNETLVIISDSWTPKVELPANIKHFNNISGQASHGWFNACKANIIPIDDGRICSGDTVLLTGMMLKKATVITKPSTLAEMYIDDDVTGIVINKNVDEAVDAIYGLLNNIDKVAQIGEDARKKYLECFSRYALGQNLCKLIFGRQ